MTPAVGYTEMKESGIEWVGRIPAHWMLRRIKTLATEKDSLFIDGDWINAQDISESGIRYLTTGNIGQGIFKEQGEGYISEETFERLRCLEVHAGDLVVSRLNTPVGRACIIPVKYRRCVVAVDNVVLRPDKVYHKRFLMYCMSSDRYAEFTQLLARGTTMQRISRTQLGNICLPIPPYEEQLAIAAYLDTQCAKIDEIIAEAKASIEDYKQWKASIIYEAVTKGLDTNVEMKDSGIEWIGEIPMGWESKRLKDTFTFGKGLPITKADLVETGIPVISYGQIHAKSNTGTHLSEDLLRFVSEKYLKSNPTSVLHEGDIVLADTSEDLDGLGNATLIDTNETVFAGYHTIILRPQTPGFSKFLSYLFRTDYWRTQLRVNASGIKVFSATQKMLRSCYIVLPPKEEQDRIVLHLDDKCSIIESVIEEKTSLISDLETYKKSLIYEVVTGKRRVC